MRARPRFTLPFNTTAESLGSRLMKHPCRWNTPTTIRKSTSLPRQCETNHYRLVLDLCKNLGPLQHKRNIRCEKRVRETSLVLSLLRIVCLPSSRGREKVRVERQRCVLWVLVVVDIFRLITLHYLDKCMTRWYGEKL
jgi:hypothetical protein